MGDMNVHFYQYEIPFSADFINADRQYTAREGLLIRLQKNGYTAWGEAAPLPGFSKEKLAPTRMQLCAKKEKIFAYLSTDFTIADMLAYFQNFQLSPSLQFAILTLGYLYLIQKNKNSLADDIFSNPPQKIEMNGIINLQQSNIRQQVKELVAQGFKTIKLKVQNTPNFKKSIHALNNDFPHINLRLDANQQWTLPDAVDFLKDVEPCNIEYCEEPLHQPTVEKISRLHDKTTVPLALDESLVKNFSLCQAAKMASTLIIKPMVIGVMEKMNTLRVIAAKNQPNLVFTTSLEGAVGRLMTGILAGALGKKGTAHGLQTGGLLSDDFWRDTSFIQQNKFILPGWSQLSNLMSIDLKSLSIHEIKC